MIKEKIKEKSEVAQQFEDIFEDYHSSEGKEQRQILENRKKREEFNKENVGLK